MPGGYYEFQDYYCAAFLSDGTELSGIQPEYPLATFYHHVVGASDRIGRPLNIARKIKPMLEAIGFVDVVETAKVWPMSEWPKDPHLKELGRWGKLGAAESAYPFALHLLTREGWTVDQVRDMTDVVVRSFGHGGPKTYVLM